VVGVGVIGREICSIGKALGMRVLGVDLDPRFDEIEYASIDAALPQADIVVCAMNLTTSNLGYFDPARLRQFKPGALFVNIARGEMSPSTALLDALRAGRLAGVGLDVYDHEPEFAVALRSGQTTEDAEVQAALELAKMDTAICTPHNAFNSQQALRRKSEHSVRQLVHFLEKGRFEWPLPIGRAI
jgi:D-lactate dehydrogenase